MADRQPAGSVRALRTRPCHPGDVLPDTGDHHRVGAVDRGHPDVADRTALRDECADLRLAGIDGEHRAAPRQGVHHPAARGHEGARVRERQHAGHVRGGQLADGVAQQDVRPHPRVGHQAEQRDLQREHRGLGVAGLVEHVLRTVEHEGRQRPAQPRVQVLAHLVERLGIGGERVVELPPHARSLRPLPGEDHREPVFRPDPAADHPGVGGRGGELVQPARQVVAPDPDDHGPMRQPRPAVRQGDRDVSRLDVASFEELPQPVCLGGQGAGVRGRQQPPERQVRPRVSGPR